MSSAIAPLAMEVQRRLKARGHDLGSSGPSKDGVDGNPGVLTFQAVLVELPPVPAPPALLVPKPADRRLSFAQAQIDLPLLMLAFPQNTRAGLEPWVKPTQDACVKWGIDTFREVASFLANISVESSGLTRLTENLNYSTEALIAKFGRHRISVADANRYGRKAGQAANQTALANILYGGKFGLENLGNDKPGDGARHIGFGPKQLTGKHNQTEFGKAVGLPVAKVPDYIRTPQGGMDSAGWFWKSRNLDAAAATPGLADDRKLINGGDFGLAPVEGIFDILIEELLRRERTRT